MAIKMNSTQPPADPEAEALSILETLPDPEETDDLGIVQFSQMYGNVPMPNPAILYGVLRQGHKMMIAAPSKAGKSFSLIELALSLVTGKAWLGIPCRMSRVLYLNAEIDKNSFSNRVQKLCDKMKITKDDCKKLYCWNLRGKAIPKRENESNEDAIIRAIKAYKCDVLIIDPIYKVMTGDENSAQDIRTFLDNVDTIASRSGAAIVFVHHFGKATQSQYSDPMSRASGSGVFARDPDAIITLSALDLRNITLEQRQAAGVSQDATAFQMDFTLREFKPRHPEKVWFDDCRHIVDSGALKDTKVESNRTRNRPTKAEQNETFVKNLRTAFEENAGLCDENGGIRIASLVGKVLSLQGEPIKTDKTIRDNVKKLNGQHFRTENGVIYPVGNEKGNGNGSL